MPPRSAQISQTGLHVEVLGDLIIVTDSSTQFFAIYAKPSHAQLVLRHPAPTDDELLGRAWQAADMKARELGWINGPPTEADAPQKGVNLLGSFGRRNKVARILTHEIDKPLTGFDPGGQSTKIVRAR